MHFTELSLSSGGAKVGGAAAWPDKPGKCELFIQVEVRLE